MTNNSGLFFQMTNKFGFSVFFPINNGTIVLAVVIIITIIIKITITNNKYMTSSLKAQRKVWAILQGASFLGVKFTRKILAWYDK